MDQEWTSFPVLLFREIWFTEYWYKQVIEWEFFWRQMSPMSKGKDIPKVYNLLWVLLDKDGEFLTLLLLPVLLMPLPLLVAFACTDLSIGVEGMVRGGNALDATFLSLWIDPVNFPWINIRRDSKLTRD